MLFPLAEACKSTTAAPVIAADPRTLTTFNAWILATQVPLAVVEVTVAPPATGPAGSATKLTPSTLASKDNVPVQLPDTLIAVETVCKAGELNKVIDMQALVVKQLDALVVMLPVEDICPKAADANRRNKSSRFIVLV